MNTLMKMIILMPFLYFPEDKTEYIPAVISLAIFIVLAVVAMRLMMKKSRNDEKKFNEKYSKEIKQAKQTESHSK
ncbi:MULTISPECIES: hypothetical protein [Oceanobacillus]|uniref:hypothetical protein n=1 Tax=Oceanobacillus TaxID=182709 RepID=UPI000345291B|nr:MULTISPECIES: hypothetical protein [Oceanobacillus]MCT1579100.1 hypothetical protein [Oceanobacillus kimchii]MCT2137372.1 hypothetical protein [Oceanobacillus kimchii]